MRRSCPRAAVVRRATWVASLVPLLGMGVASASPTESTPVEATFLELTLVGGPALNPDTQGRPSPVVVRILDLVNSEAFEASDFDQVFDHPHPALQHDVLGRQEVVLHPGEILHFERDVPSPVRSLGVAAGFRDLEHAAWHLTVSIMSGRRNFLLINVDQDAIRIETIDAKRS